MLILNDLSESSETSVASVEGNLLTINGPGQCVITAFQEGNENYLEAAPMEQVLTVGEVLSVSKSISDIKAYPNPFKNEIYIQLGDGFNSQEYRVSIVDITGRSLFSETMIGESQPSFDLNYLPDGVYTMMISNDYDIIKRRIIKAVGLSIK